MLIEAHLCQLKCLPACGGVHVSDYINTWHISFNQMEAASYLPGIRHLLSIFADGRLPMNTSSFIILYDSIMELIYLMIGPYQTFISYLIMLFVLTITPTSVKCKFYFMLLYLLLVILDFVKQNKGGKKRRITMSFFCT